MSPAIPTLSSRLRGMLLAMILFAPPWGASASETQSPIDRADPAVVAEEQQGAEPSDATRTLPQIRAAPSGDEVTAPEPGFLVGAVRVDGSGMLPPAVFSPAIEPYLGRWLDEVQLRALARDIADVARREGYGLARAWIPPQSVANGILRVRLDEGYIDGIEVSGPARIVVERQLAPLARGRPLKTSEIERRLLIAADLAGVSVGQARMVRRGDRSVLAVATRFLRSRTRVSLDNWGFDTVGPIRLHVSTELNSLAKWGDSLRVGGSSTPFQPAEFKMAHIGYRLPVDRNGTELQAFAYAAQSQPGAGLGNRDLEGDSYAIEFAISQPLKRSRRASLWATVDMTVRDSEFRREGELTRNDRIVAATASLYGTARLGEGRGKARISLVQGLDLLDATERGDPLASRDDADGTFTRLKLWGHFVHELGGDFSLMASAEAQFAFQPLLSGQEMGLGGRYFLRGYDYREHAGDQGAAGAVELRFDLRDLPQPLRRAQVYAYADAGDVSNLRDGRGGGSLASAGAGVRAWALHGIEASLELGVPLSDGAGGRRPDPRLSFTLGARF
jgi:hemolysin activation/secretion protein